VEPYELAEFKKLLNESLNKFTIQNEMRDLQSIDMARTNLSLKTGKCIITLMLANEYIKTAQKGVIEIVTRARN